ncbi:MAG: DinB family protein [Anaerolineales bacterium]|jgi:hypothetical protein
MEARRKFWNQQQQTLRQRFITQEDFPRAIEIFLNQHAMLHAASMSQMGLWSFEDEILDGLDVEQLRIIPGNLNHSIAWVVWLITRIEDATMNLLVAGSSQGLMEEDWLERMELPICDTGNGMDATGVAALSAAINVPVLLEYRQSVGRRTGAIVENLQPEDLRQKVESARLGQMNAQGVLRAQAGELLEYWAGLSISGLLLMPPTRHAFIQWNEVVWIKQKIR